MPNRLENSQVERNVPFTFDSLFGTHNQMTLDQRDQMIRLAWNLMQGYRVRIPVYARQPDYQNSARAYATLDADRRDGTHMYGGYNDKDSSVSIRFRFEDSPTYWSGQWSRGVINVSSLHTGTQPVNTANLTGSGYSLPHEQERFDRVVIGFYDELISAVRRIAIDGLPLTQTRPPGQAEGRANGAATMSLDVVRAMWGVAWIMAATLACSSEEDLTSASYEKSEDEFRASLITMTSTKEYKFLFAEDDHTPRGVDSLWDRYSQVCSNCGSNAILNAFKNFYDQTDVGVWTTFNDWVSRQFEFWPGLANYDEDEYDEYNDTYGEWYDSDDEWTGLAYGVRFVSRAYSGELCAFCVGSLRLRFCRDHEGWYTEERTADEHVATVSCVECNPRQSEDRTRRRIMNYSYRPAWIFYGVDGEPDFPNHDTLFMGMEIETEFSGSSYSHSYAQMLKDLCGEDEARTFIYGKSDSSLDNGVELVTHPFTYAWAQKHFPFDGFQKLLDNWGAYETHRNTGCHVHVSRNSFSSAHMWKFLAVHEHYAHLLGMYGRRGVSAGYGSLLNSVDLLKRKGIKGRYAKGLSIGGGRSGVHMADETVELRYPAGASSPELQKITMQMVQMVYEFSRDINSDLINKGVLKDQGYMLGYVQNRKERFPDLYAQQLSMFPVAKNLEEV